MWQARCDALANMVNVPAVHVQGLGSSIYDRQARSIDEWSKALLTRVLAYTSTAQGGPLAATLRPWGNSLRELAKYRPDFELDPVERGTLLSILWRLCTAIQQEPSMIPRLAVRTVIDLSHHAPDTLSLIPLHPFRRPVGLWIS